MRIIPATETSWTPPVNMPLEALQAKREENFNNYQQLSTAVFNSPDVWNHQDFIDRADGWFTDAFEEANLYFDYIAAETASSPRDRAFFMMTSELSPYFFNMSFFELYRMARNHVTTTTDSTSAQSILVTPATFQAIDQTPFFNPATPQYRWREMFNLLCDRMTTLGVRPHLRAEYNGWSQHDLAPFLIREVPQRILG